MNGKKLFFRRTDLIIIAILLLAAAGSWLAFRGSSSKDGLTALIYVNNELVMTIDLENAPNRRFALKENPDVVFEIKDGAIAFVESSCPDKICIGNGFLSRGGQIAVCLPNQIILKTVSDSETDEPEIITR